MLGFKITSRHYETDKAFEIGCEIEQFPTQNENLHWPEILGNRRMLEVPICMIEKGVVSSAALNYRYLLLFHRGNKEQR